MIRIEQVEFIPNLPYTGLAKLDLTEHDWKEFHRSEVIYVVLDGDEPLFTVGVLKQTLVSKPFIWVLACEALSLRHLRPLRKLFYERNTHERLWTVVRQDFFQALAFAKFFGFEPSREFPGYIVLER